MRRLSTEPPQACDGEVDDALALAHVDLVDLLEQRRGPAGAELVRPGA